MPSVVPAYRSAGLMTVASAIRNESGVSPYSAANARNACTYGTTSVSWSRTTPWYDHHSMTLCVREPSSARRADSALCRSASHASTQARHVLHGHFSHVVCQSWLRRHWLYVLPQGFFRDADTTVGSSSNAAAAARDADQMTRPDLAIDRNAVVTDMSRPYCSK
jgi:hypothetical protein